MMRRQNDILEMCLERLAQGDTIENCLADYPQQAEELRPLLQAAQKLYSLSPQQPSGAADKRIEQRLRRAVHQRDQETIAYWQRPFLMESIMKSLIHLVPRVALGILALGLLVFLIAQLPFWRAPEVEPMVSSTGIAVTGSESDESTAVDLSADPGEVPQYRIFAQPMPDTPEAMLAWARDFGLPDPAVYERPSSGDLTRYVIGSDGRRLNFQSAGLAGGIFYSNPQVPTTGEPLPFAEASQIAIAFLRDHNLLPATYRVDEPLFSGAANMGWQTIIVRMTAGEGVIGDLNSFGSMNVTVAANGQVASAFLRQVLVETAEPISIISAQEAYGKLLAGEVVGSSRGEMGGVNQTGTTYTRPANWQVGQTVDIVGHLELLVSMTDDSVRATLTADANSTTFHLTGDRLAEIAAETWQQAYRIQGVVTAQLHSSAWELEVQDWQHASYDAMSCLLGELVRQDDMTSFRSDEGHEYGLPQAPAEIAAGERMQVCLSLPAEAGADLTWSIIHVPPLSEQIFSGGGSGGSMVQSAVAVEQVSELEVTRVVTPVVDGEGETAVFSAIPSASGAVSIGSGVSSGELQSPYNVGDRVEMIGFIQAVRLVDDAGSSRLELQLLHDEGLVGDEKYPGFAYLLLAPAELAEEMAAYVDLHIRVIGEIVSAPEKSFFTTAQAIVVESFDRPWPEERLENFLGHFAVEELEGQQRMIFTDHATEQRYVVDPHYPVVVREGDVRMSEDQLLLTAVTNPATEPIAGLPVLLNRGIATGSDIAAATDLSQFPQPTENRIGTINEAFLRGNEIGENDVIERVELVYPYDPYANQSIVQAQAVEPLWVFYGRNAQGTIYFTLSVKAAK